MAAFVSVPSEPSSPPIESILFHPHILPLETHWHSKSSSVTVFLCILRRCAIEQIVMVTDALGYSVRDCPEIVISTGNVVDKMNPVATWNLREEHPSGIKPFTEVSFRFDIPQSSRLVSLKFTVPSTEATASQPPVPHHPGSAATSLPALHIGRLSFVIDDRWFEVPVVGESTTVSTLYIEQIKSPKTQVVRNHVRPLHMRMRTSKMKTEFEIDPFHMYGFSMLVRHKDRRPNTQVRELRVVINHMNLRGEVFQQTQLGVFVIPRVSANTTLYFDFESQIKGNAVTFECLSTYGDDEMCPPGRIQMY